MKLPRGKLYINLFTLIKCLIKILLNIGLSRGTKTKELENTLVNMEEINVSRHLHAGCRFIMF